LNIKISESIILFFSGHSIPFCFQDHIIFKNFEQSEYLFEFTLVFHCFLPNFIKVIFLRILFLIA